MRKGVQTKKSKQVFSESVFLHLLRFAIIFQVNLNDEDPNLQELLQAGRGGILMEDFVKYSLDMKLLDVQVRQDSSSSFAGNHYVGLF